jgi:hypothetical protein
MTNDDTIDSDCEGSDDTHTTSILPSHVMTVDLAFYRHACVVQVYFSTRSHLEVGKGVVAMIQTGGSVAQPSAIDRRIHCEKAR